MLHLHSSCKCFDGFGILSMHELLTGSACQQTVWHLTLYTMPDDDAILLTVVMPMHTENVPDNHR